MPTCVKRRGPNRKTKVMHTFIITRIVGKSAGIDRRDDITVFYLYFRRDCQRVYQACYCQEHQRDVVEGWSWRQRVRLKRIAYATTALSTQNIVLAICDPFFQLRYLLTRSRNHRICLPCSLLTKPVENEILPGNSPACGKYMKNYR